MCADDPLDREVARSIGITVRETRTGEYYFIPPTFTPMCIDELYFPGDLF